MIRYLLIGTCAAVLAGGGVALAQMPPGGHDGDGPHGSMDHEEHMGDMMEHMHRHHGGGGMPHGTAFHFKKGDAEVDIACSEGESVQACVAGASALLDKLGYASATSKPTQ